MKKDLSKMKEVAEELIGCVDGIVSEENIKGVVTVFQSILKGSDDIWEKHIHEHTESILAEYNVKCEGCDTPASIFRYKKGIVIGEGLGNS